MVRNASAYAALLHQDLQISNIRAKRRPPGLRAQHAAALHLAAALGGGHLEGGTVGSTAVHYYCRSTAPLSPPLYPHFRADTGTAGSVVLLLQAALPGALFLDHRTAAAAPSPAKVDLPLEHFDERCAGLVVELDLRGGTNASLAPQYDYWERVLVPTLLQHCLPPLPLPPSSSAEDRDAVGGDDHPPSSHRIQGRVVKRGYYPRGGGQVQVRIHPLAPHQAIRPFRLVDRGTELLAVSVRSFHAGYVPRHAAQRMADAAVAALQVSHGGGGGSGDSGAFAAPGIVWTVDVVSESPHTAVGSGGGILLVAETNTGCRLAGSALLPTVRPPRKRKKEKPSSSSTGRPHHRGDELQEQDDVASTADAAGRAAAAELMQAWSDGGCTDDWLQDQLILYMALADGTSELLVGSLTLHTRTAMDVAQQVAGATFEVERLSHHPSSDTARAGVASAAHSGAAAEYGSEGRIPGRHLIQCHGIGYRSGTAPPPCNPTGSEERTRSDVEASKTDSWVGRRSSAAAVRGHGSAASRPDAPVVKAD